MKRISNMFVKMYSCINVFIDIDISPRYVNTGIFPCYISHNPYESCRFGAGNGGGPCTTCKLR